MRKMLISLLIITVTILSTNGYPSNPVDYEQIAFQVPVDQQFVQQTADVNYFDVDDSQSTSLLDQTTDFTISCSGRDRICTRKSDCLNGYIHVANNVTDFLVHKEQACKVQDEVCCHVIVDLPPIDSPRIETSSQGSRGVVHEPVFVKQNPVVIHHNVPESFGDSINSQVVSVPGGPIVEQIPTGVLTIPTHVQLGCAAALLCVGEQFCTVDGTISPEPVSLTSRQLLQRVPLSSCKHPETGIIGKCCRDPNYVDPWPATNLPANYSGGFDEQGFPTFLNIARVRPVVTTPQPIIQTPRPEPTKQTAIQWENSNISTKILVPPPETSVETKNAVDGTNVVEVKAKCGVRHRNPEISDSRTVFGEIPWQAMVLHSKDKKILCSGALVSAHDVLTAANCVDSMVPNDLSIKLGEWKLGYELKHEEPLPYEILNVSYINIHPGYTKGVGDHDLAVLRLEKPAVLDYHVNPLCLPQTNQLQEKKSCIATGWGKSILQAHYTGAIMHAVDMNILSTNFCKEQLLSANANPDAANGIICTAPKEDINNVCEVDVGGPLACKNEQGYYELIGIYSQDTGCVASNQVAIFALFDDRWVKDTMLTKYFEQSFSTETDEINRGVVISDTYRDSILSEDNQYLPPN
ncbi:inactive serine protease scarface [Nomia melanderi]|uniref:inactive serine protease scarface n=1 Tax=Nomia melanderi TaxID=2448451 RepID=UPI0013047781|nr:inactive serine protease scarface-like [Nomia melanderi]